MVRITSTASYNESFNTIDNAEKANDIVSVIMNETEAEAKEKIVSHSKFVVSCFCSRRPGYYLFNFFAFVFLLTVLSLTLFCVNVNNPAPRIAGTFTLILTLFNFKIVTSKSLPTISYLTSLDKYEIVNLIFLVVCCFWHSIGSSLITDPNLQLSIDKIILIILGVIFFLIQIIFIISLLRSFHKLKILKKKNLKYKKIVSTYGKAEEYD